MTDDTGPGPDRLDMLVEVELTPPTEGDDIGIGEPFRVEYRTEEGVKTHAPAHGEGGGRLDGAGVARGRLGRGRPLRTGSRRREESS